LSPRCTVAGIIGANPRGEGWVPPLGKRKANQKGISELVVGDATGGVCCVGVEAAAALEGMRQRTHGMFLPWKEAMS